LLREALKSSEADFFTGETEGHKDLERPEHSSPSYLFKIHGIVSTPGALISASLGLLKHCIHRFIHWFRESALTDVIT